MYEEKKSNLLSVVPENGLDERSSDQPGLGVRGGMSNTPLTSLYLVGRNVFVDYLKVRFHGSFSFTNQEELELLTPLFKILKINPAYYDEKLTRSWKNFYEYDDGTAIMSSTDLTESKTGASHYLELKGQGCRAFEIRGGNWAELMSYCDKHATAVMRIDLSMDDTSGILKMPQILDKIYKGHYSTSLRVWRTIDGGEVKDEMPNIIQSKNDGCTITFGGRSSKQLVIYNKAAERIANRFTVAHNDWIRYESRFYNETGYKVLKQTAEAMQNNTFNILVPSLIAGLVDFKVQTQAGKSNISHSKTWPKWEELLGNVEAIKVNNQADVETSLAKKQAWLATASSRILSKAYLANPREFLNYVYFCIASGKDRFKNIDLAQVNNLRIQLGKKPYSKEEAMYELSAFDDYAIPNEYLSKVLKRSDIEDSDEQFNNEGDGEEYE